MSKHSRKAASETGFDLQQMPDDGVTQGGVVRELSLEELAALPDEAINTGDIPELDDAFWSRAQLVQPDRTKLVTLRIKQSVLDAFKQQAELQAAGKATGDKKTGDRKAGDRKAGAARGYQTHMNAVLESYVRTMLTDRKRA
jgi:uncharacterized protein (DUF4415 family)